MRALNVLLSILISLLLALVVFEVGLRIVGYGPPKTLNEFHPTLGWSKRPNTSTHRKTGEYDVTFAVNQLGLRDDPMDSPAKPAGRYRVVALGDSFTLGFTVSRDDLFVDQLERWWQAEGRDVDVINTGTEGYSTDQETVWLRENGEAFAPDLVLLFAYENDFYWNSQKDYLGKDKPRFDERGELDYAGPFPTPPAPGLEKRLALANTWHKLTHSGPVPPLFHPAQGSREILKEFAVVLPAPPGFATDAVRRTRGALQALRDEAESLGARLVVVPIPSHSAVDEAFAAKFGRGALGLEPDAWIPDLPVDTFLNLAAGLGIESIDPRAALRAATSSEGDQYYLRDWHLNPAGNRTLATVVHDELQRFAVFGDEHAATANAQLPDAPAAGAGIPFWQKLFAVLFVALSALHWATYRQLPKWRAPLEVGGMLIVIFTIFLTGKRALAALPPLYAAPLAFLFVGGILIFVAYKLGRRLSTILELFKAFTLRGHWYLMPLVVVLLSIGSLLVVAASSPLVAPFIYTLF